MALAAIIANAHISWRNMKNPGSNERRKSLKSGETVMATSAMKSLKNVSVMARAATNKSA
jgi:hypothetical protein